MNSKYTVKDLTIKVGFLTKMLELNKARAEANHLRKLKGAKHGNNKTH